MERNIVVQELAHSIEEREFEICEHKGIGHPDTITDGVCEAASRALSQAYLQEFGTILHHNVDKGLLVAGSSHPSFGGGTLIDKVKLIICGRASSVEGKIDVPGLCKDAAKKWIKDNLRVPLSYFDIQTEIKEGSGNLKEVYAREQGVPLANDTSFGVGFAPFSRLESAVLDTARLLNDKEFLKEYPAVGDDFKVMGLRHGDDITLTTCIAFIARHVRDAEQYNAIKEGVTRAIEENCALPVRARINTLDAQHPKTVDEIFLTVSGTSAEMGDDGQVGRGNRVNGTITPGRVMSLEAAAGKNPRSHIGKLYNGLANRIAQGIYASSGEVQEVRVQLLSAIGRPIDQPQVAGIDVIAGGGLTPQLKETARRIADAYLADIERITQGYVDGSLPTY